MTIKEQFSDKEYRESYADTFLDTWIATQLRVLREQRDLTQDQLATLAGMLQSRISTLEDVDYSNWSIKTLKRLGHALDVPLFVSWGTYGQLLGLSESFSRASLERPKFDDDPAFEATDVPASVRTEVDLPNNNVIDAVNRFGLWSDMQDAA